MSPDPEPPEVPVEQAVVADQAAAHATAPHGHHGPFHTHCENCGAPLAGPWCHRCGQHDFEFHRSFRHVFLEALESFLHFDGTFFRTTGKLLFRPGLLTAEFNAGKRAAQMPPFRLYVFVAFVFFLVMHFRVPPEAVMQLDDPASAARAGGEAYRAAWTELTRELRPEDLTDARKIQAVSAAARRSAVRLEEKLRAAGPAKTPPTPEQLQAMVADAVAAEKAAPPEAAATPPAPAATGVTLDQNPRLEARLNRFFERAADPQERRLLGEKFFAALPKVLLVCLPFFALFTRLLYRRVSDMVYLKHLVLALHFHTFIYLWQLLTLGVERVAALPGWGLEKPVAFLAGLWLAAYPFLMFRRLFGNGWKKTVAKTLLLAAAYFALLAAAVAVTAALIFAF